MTGLVFDVQGHSVHDGPGCRTLVFLSGCPLRCQWCCNPEGLLPAQRLMFRARLCAACPTRCVVACPRGAITPHAAVVGPPPIPDSRSQQLQAGDHGGSSSASEPAEPAPLVTIDRSRCDGCTTFDCVAVCYRQALQVSGRHYTPDDLMRVLLRDQQYWGDGGGVTFTGGEPLLQFAFLRAVLERCRDAAMHVAVETSACVPTEHLLAILPLVNWLFVDLKHVDDEWHRAGTGADNCLVLDNIGEAARAMTDRGDGSRLVVRTTIVPGFNDDVEQARRAAAALTERGVREVNLLPFHRLGASKYAQLGLAYAAENWPSPADETLDALAAIYRAAGLACYVAYRTPF